MILVTGGTGLVGSHLLLDLTVKGLTVRATKRAQSSLDNVRKVFSLYAENGTELFESIEWIDADLLDLPALELAFADVTHVYHCAAVIAFDPKQYKNLRNTNITGTANVVNLCISNNIEKLVHVSSIAALGDNKQLISETTHWNSEGQNSMYAISKYGAELEVWRASQEGLQVVVVNPGVILGDVFFKTGSGKIFTKLKNGFKHFTSGSIGFVDVKDVSTTMIKLMESDIHQEQFILITENWSYEKLFRSIVQHMGKSTKLKKTSANQLKIAYWLDTIKGKLFFGKRSLFKSTIKTSQKTLLYDNTKIKEALDFEFIPLEESVKRIATSSHLC
ncbi:MAG: NAD-dependent epimerase/dehydratase family protein [Flavobacteriaceae bacterium]|nr:NAD-dependent epimerase/dehydratase family protein [Flavobacteriaceae bacterium]